MKLKIFLKPTKAKILIFIILLLVFPNINIGKSLACTSFLPPQCIASRYLELSFSMFKAETYSNAKQFLTAALVKFDLSQLSKLAEKSRIEKMPIFLSLIINLIVFYLISCLIVLIYKNTKKLKK